MLSLIRKGKITCENCGTQTTRNKIVRYKKVCSAGTLCGTQCPNFSTTSQDDVNYLVAKKYNALEPVVTFECKHCYQHFPGFYALPQHEGTQHGFPINTANIDRDDIINKVDDANLKEEMRSFHHFFVDSELECARHKVFSYAIEN